MSSTRSGRGQPGTPGASRQGWSPTHTVIRDFSGVVLPDWYPTPRPKSPTGHSRDGRGFGLRVAGWVAECPPCANQHPHHRAVRASERWPFQLCARVSWREEARASRREGLSGAHRLVCSRGDGARPMRLGCLRSRCPATSIPCRLPTAILCSTESYSSTADRYFPCIWRWTRGSRCRCEWDGSNANW